MRAELVPYAENATSPIRRIEVDFQFEGRPSAYVRFSVTGVEDSLLIPEPSEDLRRAKRSDQIGFALAAVASIATRSNRPYKSLSKPSQIGRADDLWKHTCFEIFAKLPGNGYAEFNISPSGQWAAYRFDDYRSGMKNLDAYVDVCSVKREEGSLEIAAFVGWQGWFDVQALSASAVIESVTGDKAYWATAHPSDKPDFHHPDSFVVRMPTPEHP